MQFILFINVKMPTIVGILSFIDRINTTSESLKASAIFIFQHFSFYEQLKFHARSWMFNKNSMIRKYHNHKLQTNLWHHEEEPHNNHETPERHTKQSNQLCLTHQDNCKTSIGHKVIAPSSKRHCNTGYQHIYIIIYMGESSKFPKS